MEKNEKKAPAAKKGNKTTEIIIGAANVKFLAALKSLHEGFAQLEGIEEKVQDSVLLVSDLEDKIGGLEQDFKNKEAQQAIDLKLAYDSKREEFVSDYLQGKKLTTISNEELSELKTKAYVTEQDQKKAVDAAVAAVTGALKKEHESEKKIAQLEHEKKEAANVAEIAQLKQQNQFLEKQLSDMKDLLETQMENETKRSANQPAIHVNGTNTGR